jgi:flagellar FliL protein
MSAATPTADAGAAPPKGKKKLIIIIVAVVLVLVLGGVGALLMLKKGASHEEEDGADSAKPKAAVSTRDPKTPPVFAPLEAFTVNLADKDADRYAQVGITLEMTDQSAADALKTFMPAIRNNVLMLLAHKTAAELMARDGKEQLAREVKLETARGLGYEVPAAEPEDDEDTSSSKKKKRKKQEEPDLPIVAVYFSTFIIQ